MKFSNLKSVLYCVLITAAFACSKKDDPEVVSATEGKAIVNSSSAQVETSSAEFNNAEGVKAAASLDALGIGTYSPGNPGETSNMRKENGKSFAYIVKKYFPLFRSGNISSTIDPEFNTAKGIYEYNFTTKAFAKTGTSDKVVIKFPYPTTSGVNNCVYTVSQFENTMVDGEKKPTKVAADLSINNVKVLDFSAALSYDNDGEVNNADVTYGIGEKSIKWKANLGTVKTSASVGFYKNNNIVIGYDVTLTMDEKENLNLAEFNYILADITFKGSYDLKGLVAEFFNAATTSGTNMTEEKTNEIIDKYIKFELVKTSNNAKIASVKLRTRNNATVYVIIYNDGSEDDFTPIQNALEKAAFSFNFGGDFDLN